MVRAQFSIRTLLWFTLVVAAFLGGMAAEHRITSIQATKRERRLEREVAALMAEIRRREEEARHFEFRLEQMEKRRDKAMK